MTYLVAIPKEKVTDGKWTTAREPVVPCFPSQHAGAFLALPSFKLAEKAEVADPGPDFDPDALADLLAKEYPGLPRTLHENYILKTWEAVRELAPGRVFRIKVNQRQALLIDDRTNTTIAVWTEQPLT